MSKMTMTFIIALSILFTLSQGSVDPWISFRNSFGKEYLHEKEELFRRQVFNENMDWIAAHNQLFEQGQVSFQVKMNQYGDMTEVEFRDVMLTANMSLSTAEGSTFLLTSIAGDVPERVDWRDSKAVSRVKDQGSCGSCWAFSTIGSLESMSFLKSGEMLTLSEQQLVDCSQRYGNNGCRGGLPERALMYIKNNGGVESDTDYPYKAADRICRFDKKKIGAKIAGFVKTKRGDENELRGAVATVGPVSVCIDATNNFRFYSKGIFNDRTCSSQSINHAVLVVGYGTENGQDYWLVKNSWGTSWGDSGYIKMSRNKNNQCAIANYAVYPLV